MPFGMVSAGIGRRMGVLYGVAIVEGEGPEGAALGDEFGASHCNQMGTLLRSCARATRSSQITLGGLVKLCERTDRQTSKQGICR